MSSQTRLLQELDQLRSSAKRRYLMFALWRQLPFVIVLMGILFLVSHSILVTLITTIALLALSVYRIVNSHHWEQFSQNGMLMHLNTEFEQLEHSAQLVIAEDQANNLLFTLQKRKIIEQITSLLSANQNLLPEYPIRKSQIHSALLIMVVGTLILLNPFQAIQNILTGENAKGPKNGTPTAQSYFSVSISVSPPAYSGQADFQQDKLDLSVLEGSEIIWTVEASGATPILSLSNGEDVEFTQQAKNTYAASLIASQSTIYRIDIANQQNQSVNSISVIKDTPPKIRVVEPQNTITEFKKASAPIFTTKVIVRDDFDISKVDILASVAKGSGEAVKFRDETFEFDRQTRTEHTLELHKSWSAEELGLEPGDELYFTVRAWDNKQPDAQLSRSDTKIFRWLDDDEQAIVSDGILIDFMPEYFKSQRQIIIETQQLIADKDILSEQEFEQTSRSLGHSQSDLKLKYGQYLGDEFDDGSGGHQMEQGPGVPDIHIHDGDHNDDDHDEDDHDGQPAAGNLQPHSEADNGHDGHDHGEGTPSLNATDQDKSGYQQTITQYGHNHGDTDIGVMGTQSPKALMKRAIANMWDAELHLMLSAPEKALPFEQQALIFLNQARKAERIYVKRLGFEPPPVTEKRRYQGDLSDILSYQQNQAGAGGDPIHQDMEKLIKQLLLSTSPSSVDAEIVSATNPPHLEKANLDLINRVQQHLSMLAQTRPALMRHVATLQQIQLQKSVNIDNCESCVESLYRELWRQLPAAVAQPASQQLPYSRNDASIEYYQQFLRTNKTQSGSTP